MSQYNENHFEGNFFQKEFLKSVATQVKEFIGVPQDMDMIEIPESIYAVFQYKGSQKNAHKAFRFIFGTWLPKSGYELDNRPHFEILGAKYKQNSDDSEEEIWIPIKKKQK